jgi:hypothetical protein
MLKSKAESASAAVMNALAPLHLQQLSVGVSVPKTDSEDDYRVAVRVENDEQAAQVKAAISGILDLTKDVDLQVVGTVVPIPLADITPAHGIAPLGIGMAIRRRDIKTKQIDNAGTLGFFGTRNGKRGLVSCNHVIANIDNYNRGDEIVSTDDNDVIGRLRRVARLKGTRQRMADCAFAEVEDGRYPAHPGSLGTDGLLSSEPARVRKWMPVIKQGHGTGRRIGKIVAYGMWKWVPYPTMNLLFYDIFEIESHSVDANGNDARFCDRGDSGSLIYTAEGEGKPKHPVGLLFAQTQIGGLNGNGLGYANPIGRVMRALGVTLDAG